MRIPIRPFLLVFPLFLIFAACGGDKDDVVSIGSEIVAIETEEGAITEIEPINNSYQ